MILPLKLTWDIAQTRWATLIEPFLTNNLNSVNILQGISLINGVNTINHKLGRTQQGWFLTDINAAATIFRSEAFNTKTLTLTSNAACVVNIGVF